MLAWQNADWRVVRVLDDDFPAYYRVIAAAHVAEFSSLAAVSRHRCMDLVAAVEATLMARLKPTKINLAAFGNMVPHLHWHVMARFEWDSHFPQPYWGMRQRDVVPPARQRIGLELPELDAAVAAAVAGV